MRILMDNAIVTGDLGGPSIVSAFCDITKQNQDGAQIDMLSLTVSEEDKKYLDFLKVGYMEYGSFLSIKNIFKIWGSIARCKKGKPCRTEKPIEKFVYRLSEYDVLVDMGGICFTDDIPSKNLIQALLSHRIWILCKKLGVKVVLYTTAIGPFRTKRNIKAFKMYLNKYCDYAIMRDEKSEELYNKYNIKTPYCVAPDTAFLMKAVRPMDSVVKQNVSDANMIGISLSFQLQKKTPGYFETLEKVCRAVLDRGFKLLLIANECSGFEGSDDRFVVKKMSETLQSDNVIIANPVEMNGNELKWLIGQCEATISSRYHTLIASISSGVPCVALSWHHKYKEALALVGQEKYIVENKEFDADKIIELFDDLYKNKEENARLIQQNIQVVQEKVLEANKQFLDAVENN